MSNDSPTGGSDWRTAGPDQRLTDAAEAVEPLETSFAGAQADANFVVFEPDWLPVDCAITETTLRPEHLPGRPDGVEADELGQTPWSNGNPAAVRTVVVGEGRQLRIKQFLYDWAPPAASVAPLWGTEDPTPVEAGDTVGFLGTDYKDNRGACVQRARTQIEVSVLDGEFGDADLERVLNGLKPAVSADDGDFESVAPRQVPFHRLSYWARYRCESPGVPHGLWDHGVARPYNESVPCSPAAFQATEPALLVPGDDSVGGTYAFDSAVTFPNTGGSKPSIATTPTGAIICGSPQQRGIARSAPTFHQRPPTSPPRIGRRSNYAAKLSTMRP